MESTKRKFVIKKEEIKNKNVISGPKSKLFPKKNKFVVVSIGDKNDNAPPSTSKIGNNVINVNKVMNPKNKDDSYSIEIMDARKNNPNNIANSDVNNFGNIRDNYNNNNINNYPLSNVMEVSKYIYF